MTPIRATSVQFTTKFFNEQNPPFYYLTLNTKNLPKISLEPDLSQPIPSPNLHFKGFFLHSQVKMTTAMILLIRVKIADCSQKVFFLATNWQVVYSSSSYYCPLEMLWLHHKELLSTCVSALCMGTSTSWGGTSTSSFPMRYGKSPKTLNNKEQTPSTFAKAILHQLWEKPEVTFITTLCRC